MKEKIVLIGGGGHCHSVIDVLEQTNKYEIIGIVDIKKNIGKKGIGGCYPKKNKRGGGGVLFGACSSAPRSPLGSGKPNFGKLFEFFQKSIIRQQKIE